MPRMSHKCHMMKTHAEALTTPQSTNHYERSQVARRQQTMLWGTVADTDNCGEQQDTHTHLSTGDEKGFMWSSTRGTDIIFVRERRRLGDGKQCSHPRESYWQTLPTLFLSLCVFNPAAERLACIGFEVLSCLPWGGGRQKEMAWEKLSNFILFCLSESDICTYKVARYIDLCFQIHGLSMK